MGLLDSLNLDDPKTITLLSMGLGLMSPSSVKTNFGGQLSRAGQEGLLSYGQAKQSQMQQQTQERANRASDLQQLQSSYLLERQANMPRIIAAAQSGQPYEPSPRESLLQDKLTKLIDLPMASGQYAPSAPSAMPSAAPTNPPAPMPPPQAGAAYGLDLSPLPRTQIPPPPPPQAPMPPSGGPPPNGAFAPAGGQPAAFWLGIDPTGKLYAEQLAKDHQPIALRQGDLVGLGKNGNYESKFQQPPTVPGVAYGRDNAGQVNQAREIPGFAPAASSVAGATATATKGSNLVTVPVGNGQTTQMTQAEYLRRMSASPASPPGLDPSIPPIALPGRAGIQITPDVQAQRDQVRGRMISQEIPGEPNPSIRADLQKELSGVPGYSPGSGGFGVTPSAPYLAGQTADATAAAESRQSVMKTDYQDLAHQNATAQTVISRLQTIKQLGPKAITGAESDRRDFFNGLLSLAGLKGANDAKTASDLIDKNAAQIALAIGAGSQGTDALRALALAANPGRHMNLEAMQGAADSLIAPLQMTQAKTQLLTTPYTNGDSKTYLTQKQAFERSADPRVWELQNLSPDKQKAYVSNLSPSDAQQLLASRAQLRAMKVIP